MAKDDQPLTVTEFTDFMKPVIDALGKLEQGQKRLEKDVSQIKDRLETVESDVKFIKRDVSELKRDTGEALMRLERVEKGQKDHEERITKLERSRLN